MIREILRLSARFRSNHAADSARIAVTDTLVAAQKETNAIFERQGGTAEASDIAAVYIKYGFKNDCGWQQDVPLFVEENILFWEIPEGMQIEEAEQLLLALGAMSIKHEDGFEDDLLRSVPHPAALFLSEFEDMQDFEEDDAACFEGCDKKTIH